MPRLRRSAPLRPVRGDAVPTSTTGGGAGHSCAPDPRSLRPGTRRTCGSSDKPRRPGRGICGPADLVRMVEPAAAGRRYLDLTAPMRGATTSELHAPGPSASTPGRVDGICGPATVRPSPNSAQRRLPTDGICGPDPSPPAPRSRAPSAGHVGAYARSSRSAPAPPHLSGAAPRRGREGGVAALGRLGAHPGRPGRWSRLHTRTTRRKAEARQRLRRRRLPAVVLWTDERARRNTGRGLRISPADGAWRAGGRGAAACPPLVGLRNRPANAACRCLPRQEMRPSCSRFGQPEQRGAMRVSKMCVTASRSPEEPRDRNHVGKRLRR